MSIRVTGNIESKLWEERPFAEEANAPKLTRANGSDLYHGEIEAEGTFEYLMLYGDDGVTPFIGMTRVVGRLGNRQGSFVMQGSGVHANGGVRATLSVMAGSGTGDLKGLRGEGTLVWNQEEQRLTL
ncbi:MAG TPA: DUF3224 domain-containing protein, partial [Ktedonobacterales bacterium]|nr:DUF3224 domain-containing protein [Ktedonobacterales bacterium]